MEINITYACEGFFDGCDNMEGVDTNATISAWESLVEKRLAEAYPDAEININQKRSCFGRVEVDDRQDSNDAANVKRIMDEAFASEMIWK